MTPILLTALTLPGPTAEWSTLTKSPSHVECTKAEPVFCRSTAVFQATQATLTATLGDMPKHKDGFESIVELHELEKIDRNCEPPDSGLMVEMLWSPLRV